MNCTTTRWTRALITTAAGLLSLACSQSIAQCPQAWIENGGLPATAAAGSFNRAAILEVGGHEFLLAGGTFNAVNDVSTLNLVAFDNGTAVSPSSLPGWSPITGIVNEIKEFEGRIYFAGFMAVNGATNVPLISWDGSTLEVFPSTTVPTAMVCIGSSGGQRKIFINSSGFLNRYENNTWVPLPFNLQSQGAVRSLEFLDDTSGGRLIMLDTRSEFFAFRSGSWLQFSNSSIGAPPPGFGTPFVNVMRAEGHGAEATLYAGGAFGTINGITVKSIAKWRDGNWSPLGAGVASQVYAITRGGNHNDLLIATRTGAVSGAYQPQPSVFALRDDSWLPILRSPADPPLTPPNSFGLVGGPHRVLLLGNVQNRVTDTLVTPMAQWDGNAWSSAIESIGSGGTVAAIEQLDIGNGPEVFATGNFRTIDGELQSVAKFDGENWLPLGAGLPYTNVNSTGIGGTALGVGRTTFGPRLLASGFDQSTNQLFMKMFDGAAWSDLSTGLTGTNANQIFDYDGGLGMRTYAIAAFSGTPLQWLDGAQWRSIDGGNGISLYPFTATTFDNGDGEFIYIGRAGTPVDLSRFIVRWSPATGYQNFDSGLPSPTPQSKGVHVLFKMPNGGGTTLLAGGDFEGPSGRHLARLVGSQWQMFNPVVPGPVADLAMHDFGNGPVLTALVYDQPYRTSQRYTPYRLVNNSWQQFGTLGLSSPVVYTSKHAVGVLRDIDGTLYVGGSILSVDSKVSTLIARYGPGHCFCAGDFNHDDAADFFDYLDFVSAFAYGEARADVNHDSAIDFFDYLDFVDALAGGC